MGTKYEHITEQTGASYDTNYKVITICTTDCPACAFKAGIKEVIDWISNEASLWTEHYPFTGVTRVLNEQRWRAKLKEWGIIKDA